MLKKISDLTQEEIGIILDNIKSENSYYVGGSLCVDNKLLKSEDVLIMNLDETFFGLNESKKYILSRDNVIKLFKIYKHHKGETEYFKEKLKKSSILNLEL